MDSRKRQEQQGKAVGGSVLIWILASWVFIFANFYVCVEPHPSLAALNNPVDALKYQCLECPDVRKATVYLEHQGAFKVHLCLGIRQSSNINVNGAKMY